MGHPPPTSTAGPPRTNTTGAGMGAAEAARTDALGLLDGAGYMRLLPAGELDAIPRGALRLWCHFQARYHLPTLETVDWLRGLIGGRRALEIGAGAGDLARHLGVPATDLRVQEDPAVAAYYLTLGQPLIRYPPAVRRMEAADAVAEYRPDVVVAAWVTDRASGNAFGPDEAALVRAGLPYVFIGNRTTHRDKAILSLPHREHALPFLRSRAEDRAGERIWIWNGDKLQG